MIRKRTIGSRLMVIDMNVDILFAIGILLLFAKVFGEITERLKMGSLIGEVTGGIIAGPLLGIVTPDPFIAELAGFGILFFLFLVGLQTRFEEVKGNIYSSSFLAVMGALLSFLAGFVIGYIVFNDVLIGAVIGMALTATSDVVPIRSLMDIGELNTKIGKMVVAVNLADDVVAILSMSILTTFLSLGAVRVWEISILFFAIIGFFLVILTFGSKVVGRFLTMFQTMRDEYMLLSVPLIVMFIVVYASEHIVLAGVVGAFLAGMAMSKSSITEPVIIPKVKTVGYGFFIPLFFAYSAIAINLGAMNMAMLFVITLLVIGAIAGKYIGVGFFSAYYKFKKEDRRILGISMIPRGEYTIIIGQLALASAVINSSIYTALIFTALITIIITPMALRMVRKKA